jgi:hypothetical protein
LPEAEFLEASRRHPLIQTRFPLGEDLPPLERLLRDPRPETHERLAVALVDSGSREEALERALGLAADLPAFDSTALLPGPRDETLAAG